MSVTETSLFLQQPLWSEGPLMTPAEILQAVVDEAGMEACVWEREYLAEAETAWLDELEAAGMQINYPEKDAFVEATKSVYDEFVGDEAGKVSPELLEKVYEIIGRE